MPRILIGLGSNIDPEDQLNAAAVMLRDQWPTIQFSSVYRSKPWGLEDQDDFLNAAALVDADHEPQDVLQFLQEIEQRRKKDVRKRYGPRTIDLDLLLHGDAIIPDLKDWQPTLENVGLVLPHPRMHERRFVLQPMLDLIDPTEKHPIFEKTWKELLEAVEEQEVWKMPMQL